MAGYYRQKLTENYVIERRRPSEEDLPAVETRLRDLRRGLSATYDTDALLARTAEIRRMQRLQGSLLLARDKSMRPEIHGIG
jgi:hypothetical protein